MELLVLSNKIVADKFGISLKEFTTQVAPPTGQLRGSARALEQEQESDPSNNDRKTTCRVRWQNQNALLQAKQVGRNYRHMRMTGI